MSVLDGICLASSFAETLKEGGLILSCGGRGSGKSTFMLATLHACYDMGTYEDYNLIFPSLHVEASGAYEWCLKVKHFTIYTGYHESILEKIYKRNQDEDKRKRTLIIIDDATAFASDLHRGVNDDIVKLVCQLRHVKVTIWLLVHSLKNVISPVLRDNLSYLIIYDITNKRLLNTIWEEYLSVFVDEKQFLEWYRELQKEKYKSFMLKCTKPVSIDTASNEWQFVSKYREKHLKLCKPKV